MDNIFDIIIIGGGINGAGIARDAAGRKIKVCLIEKNNIGSATSSWSTKLIHGGLRYLENFEFKLVKGDTKATLTQQKDFDIAYLDGGHSFETVKHDYNMCKQLPVVVFDDYFTKDEGGKEVADEHVDVMELEPVKAIEIETKNISG